MDITNFYLNTPLDQPEYLKIPINLIPTKIMHKYHLDTKVKNRTVMACINKGMYGLPQAGILANKLLKQQLEPHRYHKCTHTPGLWKHHSRKLMFALVVDDFGIQFSNVTDAQHLLAALKQDYEAVTVDWTRLLFCRITLAWDYNNQTVDLSMPGYVKNALTEFLFTPAPKPEHQPHQHQPLQYGVKTQLTAPIDESEPLSKEGNLRLQQITGKFQYYSVLLTQHHSEHTGVSADTQDKTNRSRCQQIPKLLCHLS
jgi:Reverse transcriptase (RNA-dependent DNA polymerase)